MLWKIVQSRPFQRLRRIRQLGFSEFVFPGATHTRFAHSLGAFHNARLLMRIVRREIGTEYFDQYRSEVALTAALLHDVGHGPFSHSFEAFGKSECLRYARHEDMSDEIIRNSEVSGILEDYAPGMSGQVADVIGARVPNDVYASVVSSQFDADRLDYMRRDRMMTGTRQSEIDLTWLMANLKVEKVPFGVDGEELGEVLTFVLGAKAVHAAEAYVLGLFQLYPTVYFHKTTRSAELVFYYLFKRVFRLSNEGHADLVGLLPKNPVAAFVREPASLEKALHLDDTAIWGALVELRQSCDASIQGLADMLWERKLPKVIDLRATVEQELGAGIPEETIDRAVVLSLKALRGQREERGSGIPAVWIDTGERLPYKVFREDAGPLNRIMIQRHGGLEDIRDVSPVVRAIPPFRFERAYVPSTDEDLKTSVLEIVRKKSEEARRE